MNKKPYGIHVIVHPRFGDRLQEIPVGEPVWIVDTVVNRVAYEMSGFVKKPLARKNCPFRHDLRQGRANSDLVTGLPVRAVVPGFEYALRSDPFRSADVSAAQRQSVAHTGKKRRG